MAGVCPAEAAVVVGVLVESALFGLAVGGLLSQPAGSATRGRPTGSAQTVGGPQSARSSVYAPGGGTAVPGQLRRAFRQQPRGARYPDGEGPAKGLRLFSLACWRCGLLPHPRLSLDVAQAGSRCADRPGTGFGRPSCFTCFLAYLNRSHRICQAPLPTYTYLHLRWPTLCCLSRTQR